LKRFVDGFRASSAAHADDDAPILWRRDPDDFTVLIALLPRDDGISLRRTVERALHRLKQRLARRSFP
jgi:hypothetical protein